MRKLKIFITIFVIYEFVMLVILQIPNFCVAVFNHNFCYMNNFKYFLMCVMVPGLLMLFLWWMPDIARPFCKNKCQCDARPHTLQNNDVDRDEISKQYLEKLISSAIMIGVQNFAKTHPKTTKTFDNIIAAITDKKTVKKKK